MDTPELSAGALLSFSDLFLKKNFDEPVQTPAAHLEWWQLVCLPRQYVAISAPRGHAKSTAITHTYVCASVCFRAKRHVLIVSDTEAQAAQFLGNLRREFLENEELRATFGIKRFAKDSLDELIIEFNDGAKSRLIARGGAQKIRGTNWLGRRPDLIVCDDLENDEAVRNEDRREYFRNWFYDTLIPLGSKKVEVRVVGTILHEDSLLARLMPDEFEDPNVVVEPLRVYTTTQSEFLGVKYRAHPDFDDFSVLLWPEQWDEQTLRSKRQLYIDDGYPEGYAQEYLNNPQAGKGAYFEEDDLLPIAALEMDRTTWQPEQFYIGVDLAISLKDRRAYSAFVVAGLAADNVLRIREVIRKRMETWEIIETFLQLHEKYVARAAANIPPVFLVEKENIAKAIGPVLGREMEERDTYLLLEHMPPIHDKRLRARSIQARIRAHRVEFDHQAMWWPTLKHEMMIFDKGRYADQVDALAWIGHWLANMTAAPTEPELEEWEYEDAVAEYEYEDWGARDPITGY